MGDEVGKQPRTVLGSGGWGSNETSSNPTLFQNGVWSSEPMC